MGQILLFTIFKLGKNIILNKKKDPSLVLGTFAQTNNIFTNNYAILVLCSLNNVRVISIYMFDQRNKIKPLVVNSFSCT